ncbi:hypothetical protein [Acinetobacter celticus]|uniref:Uncharacterized protein n=1 Tax=Acinetobacter celticus TaxID=1891224 RepID=A0A1C3CUK1_9GAMM|nr:hypothetical protein [Acinetobacter celticus]ODA12450.1 hypothetical protein BBP83_11215 [Acinetobacter celticus]
MQPISKKNLLELINAELKKHPDHDGKTLVKDVEQNCDNSFEYKFDVVLSDMYQMIYSGEMTGYIAPIFDENFLLIG